MSSSQTGFWPPQSPDLNPIEHLWDVVEQEIRIMDVQPAKLQQLHDIEMIASCSCCSLEISMLVWEPVQSRRAMTWNDSKPILTWD